MRGAKRGGKKSKKEKRMRVAREVSDDEGEDAPAFLAQRVLNVKPATKAIAVLWLRKARAKLQQKAGKGAGVREESGVKEQGVFHSGGKSRSMRK
jgi:hypothetical protein